MRNEHQSLLTVGEFAKLTGLTTRALRWYDRKGLLHPDVVDPQTGYRFYQRRQAERAERVRLLRALDMPLDEVRRVLEEPDRERAKARIAAYRQQVESRIKAYREALVALEALEAQALSPYRVQVKLAPTVHVVLERHMVTLANIDGVRVAAFARLHAQLECCGARPVNSGFVALRDVESERPYLSEARTDQASLAKWRFEVEVSLPVDRPVMGFVGEQRTWASGRVVLGEHVGPYASLHLLSKTLWQWAEAQGDQLGPKREIYHVGPWQEGSAKRYRTEVQYLLL